MDRSTEVAEGPTHKSAPAGTANADDLLEQLAAAEIDRMLEEAEAGGRSAPGKTEAESIPAPAARDAAARTDDAAAAAAQETLARELEDLYAALNAGSSETAAAQASQPAPPSSGPARAQSSSVAGAAGETQSAAADVPPAAAEVAAVEAAPAEVEATARVSASASAGPAPPVQPPDAVQSRQSQQNTGESAALDPEEQTGPLEKNALTGEAQIPDGGRVENRLSAAASMVRSLAVRVLELVNLPVCGLSDGARNLMGKVAIGTLINALLLLGYLAIMKKS